jgi:hydroxymethylbilane synthase
VQPQAVLRIATRASALARWQADEVARLLRAAHLGLTVELIVVDTSGDRRQDVPIWEIGGQGVFVKEVQTAVLDGRADLAVHSAKDLPSTVAPGLQLAAFPVRADPRDALVGVGLDRLSVGATVATGSVRRRAQIAALRPDLEFASLRGNIQTRLGRIPPGGAIVMAVAALDRLGLRDRPVDVLDVDRMLPQVAQGALAVECKASDAGTAELLAAIDRPEVRLTVEAERALLARLGTGCDLPVGAHARLDGDPSTGSLVVEGLIASIDGTEIIRDRLTAPAAAGPAIGAALGGALLAAGGARLLARADRGEGDGG